MEPTLLLQSSSLPLQPRPGLVLKTAASATQLPLLMLELVVEVLRMLRVICIAPYRCCCKLNP